jgi:uncharacterized protein (TIGR03435 family)
MAARHVPPPVAAFLLFWVVGGFGLSVPSVLHGTVTSDLSSSSRAERVPLAPDSRYAKFVYDVVSIKPLHEDSAQREAWRGVRETPDGLLAHCTASFLVLRAFLYEQARLNKPAGWILDDDYDVAAKMDPEMAMELQKLGPIDQKLAREHMLQVLLQDRFKFSYHAEPREVNGFDLVVAKSGSKLKESRLNEGGDAPPPPGMRVQVLNGVSEWDGRAKPIGAMLSQLSFETGRTVSDKTGLTGTYDFTLKFVSESGAAIAGVSPLDAAPSLNTALQEQLGLKLVPSKTTRDLITIDHIERPSSN